MWSTSRTPGSQCSHRKNLRQLDEAFAQAGRTRPAGFEIIITPPMSMPMDAMPAYGELGVHRLVVNLGSQRPEQVDKRLPEIGRLVKRAA
jgi:hypothetical protein